MTMLEPSSTPLIRQSSTALQLHCSATTIVAGILEEVAKNRVAAAAAAAVDIRAMQQESTRQIHRPMTLRILCL